MVFVCPKCGKKIELSIEAQMASVFFTVCPQCLTRLQIVGSEVVIPTDDDKPKFVPAGHEPANGTQHEPQPEAAQPNIQPDQRQATKATVKLPPPLPQAPPRYRPRPQTNTPVVSSPSPMVENSAPFQQHVRHQPDKNDNYMFTCSGCMMWLIIVSAILILFSQLVTWLIS